MAYPPGNRHITDMPIPAPLGTTRRFEDEFRAAVRVRGYSMNTEKAYWMWTRQFILHHGKRHPRDMGAAEVQEFLEHLAVGRNVSASTQAQALNALAFLYKSVLGMELGDFSLVPKLCLGMPLRAKLRFARGGVSACWPPRNPPAEHPRLRNRVSLPMAFPNRVWERGRGIVTAKDLEVVTHNCKCLFGFTRLRDARSDASTPSSATRVAGAMAARAKAAEQPA